MSRIHLVGIMGSGMQGLAEVLLDQGYEVSGSDSKGIETISTLGGVIAYEEQDTSALGSAQKLIYSAAVPVTHPQREAARAAEVLQLSYPQALGELSQQRLTVAVCGTHGKTTTTAMLAQAMQAAGADPLAIVGSGVPAWGGSHVALGHDDVLVVEACEYQRGFMNLSPDLIVITNIDYDHADTYPTIEEYWQVYLDFVRKLPSTGRVIAHPDVIERLRQAGVEEELLVTADVWMGGPMQLPGDHLKQNAALVVATTAQLGLHEADVVVALRAFAGTQRRFVDHGTWNGVQFYDDYAHHPTEIAVTLAALREKHPEQRLVVVFQPHQIARTQSLWQEFVEVLTGIDQLVLVDIYAVRGERDDQAHQLSQQLATDIVSAGGVVERYEDYAAAVEALPEILQADDICMTMGAGPVDQVLGLMKAKYSVMTDR